MTDFNFHEQVTYFHTLYLIYNKYFSFIMDDINEEDSLFIRGLKNYQILYLNFNEVIVGPPIELMTLDRMLRLGIVLIDDPYPTSKIFHK